MTNIRDLRIVSLLPSATEIIDCLGLTSVLVGRSHECDYPPEVTDLPVCTTAQLNSDRQICLVDGNTYFNRPGPRLVDSTEILAEIFDPGLTQRHYNYIRGISELS